MDFSTVTKCIRKAVPFCIVIALAVALKRYYSLAGADSLVWILAPTARCVELVSGITFIFESGTGFTNLDHRAVIAPACAGINFMIIVFCMTAFCSIGRCTRSRTRLLAVSLCFLAAYCLTIGINALRIAGAVWLYDADVQFGWFTQERIHRLEGTAIYFAGLCGIYAMLTRSFRAVPHISGRVKPATTLDASPAAVIRRFITPAAWYLGVTLAVPLILGKYSLYRGQLLEHGLSVLVIPVMAVVLFLLFRGFQSVLNKNNGHKGGDRI
jgi:exosortase K